MKDLLVKWLVICIVIITIFSYIALLVHSILWILNGTHVIAGLIIVFLMATFLIAWVETW